MENPWLEIPLADYETHMASPQVAQTQMLSDIFAAAIDQYRPKSVAVLGCAGGNGFERIRADVTRRVVGIDINPHYIQQARERFAERIPTLELHVGDLRADTFQFAPVELVFAALVLEYVPADAVFGQARRMLGPGGVIVTVVQLPSDTIPEVTPSPFTSLATLSSIMRLVPPEAVVQAGSRHGFRATQSRTCAAAGGKRFCLQALAADLDDSRPGMPPQDR